MKNEIEEWLIELQQKIIQRHSSLKPLGKLIGVEIPELHIAEPTMQYRREPRGKALEISEEEKSTLITEMTKRGVSQEAAQKNLERIKSILDQGLTLDRVAEIIRQENLPPEQRWKE